ncbi:MAG: hypothetical protein IPL65_21140 [Lewinellaceae bacterium]|nr:hypothetical protein [Lewinellaceae bacterium]
MDGGKLARLEIPAAFVGQKAVLDLVCKLPTGEMKAFRDSISIGAVNDTLRLPTIF